MNSLERILRSAATAPGNRDRFDAAGLIGRSPTHQIQLAEDWQAAFLRLCPIAKATVRQAPGQFLASVDDIVYRGSTSGTQGQSFVYFADSDWNRARLKSRQAFLSQWGFRATPVINIGSRLSPVRQGDMAMAGALTAAFVDRLLQQLAAMPAVIRGYPSRLCEIAAVLLGQRWGQLPAVLGVICTGECLFDFQKVLLERVFAVPVINEYGCQESGISGLTCPEAGRLHLDSDRCLYEIVDGQFATTDLFNTVMPMVRYQCGDVVELSGDRCACGRSGPTAVLRGRTEDVIRTRTGQKYAGDVVMPPLPRILTYRVIRAAGTKVAIAVCPDPAAQPDLTALNSWISDTLGSVTAQIQIREAVVKPSPSVQGDDFETWVVQMTQGAWSTWLAQPKFPQGEGQKIAQLLYDLANPGVISSHGLSLSSWTKLQQVLNTPASESQVNEMSARVLLFACCFLWDDPSVKQVYRQAIQRSQNSLPPTPHATRLDRLVPTLFLDTPTALAIWTEWLGEIDRLQSSQPICWQVDTFTVQFVLQAFEPAMQRAWRSPSPLFRALRPFISVLIGDLSFFPLAPWLLGYWFELLHEQPLPKSLWLEPPEPDYESAWLNWRRQLIYQPQQASLAELQAAARSPAEQERTVLEEGYGLLAQAQTFDPKGWIATLHQVGESQLEGSVDIVPWQPILKALVKPLFEQGQLDLAYGCLRAATVPSSQLSAFERFAAQANYKQPVLHDLFPDAD